MQAFFLIYIFMIEERVHFQEGFLEDFCKRNHIRKLSLFGSVLRADFRPDSDIDILVEFQEDKTPSLLNVVRMERELSILLGRSVELSMPEEFREQTRERVMKEATTQYEVRGSRSPTRYFGARA